MEGGRGGGGEPSHNNKKQLYSCSTQNFSIPNKKCLLFAEYRDADKVSYNSENSGDVGEYPENPPFHNLNKTETRMTTYKKTKLLNSRTNKH